MGKIKIHEIAKELNLTSKEIIERATKLGIDVKNHLSSVEEDVAKILKDSFKKVIKETKTSEEQASNEKKTKKEKTETPVIIRREVIISDEEIAKKEEQEKKRKQEEKNKQVGFVERNTNKDFNIVYRNKPTKPLTVSELFGLKTEKKEEKVEKVEEKPKEQVEVQETKVTQETKSVAKEQPVQKQAESSNEVEETRNVRNSNYRNNNQIGGFNNQGRNFNNQNNNGYNQNRNNGYRNNNQNGGYNNQGRNFNNQNNNGYNQNRNNGYRNNNQNGGYNNQGRNFNNQNNNGYNQNRNNGYRNNDGFNRRPLDEKGIEKNIKNIMTDVVEKEQVREYNKSIDKQKQNRFEENKAKKPQKQRRGGDNFDEDKLKSLKQRDRLSNMFDEQDGGMLDFYDLTTQRGKKNKKRANKQEDRVKQKIFELTEITITDPITVKDFAAEMKKTTADVIKKLLGFGVLATINNEIDFDTAFLIAEEFGITAKKKETITEEDILFDDSEDKETDLKPRPPVVVVMGHVDHGKTSLLDAVRQTNVIEGEAGGITQHIGAYKVKIKDREITFLDTPGHEAFTSMRARGAQVTDIAILVVAANDGVMPQTIEAINHAKAAEIPIIVALNKIDVEGANPEKVKQELTKYDLVPEEWGGDTIFVEISAKKKLNIDTLLEMVLLVADMKELKANPNKQSKGTVLEAKLDKARGPVVSMLVQRGTLDIGDTIVVGSTIGRIRAMTDDKGKKVKKAGPSTPVEITGLTEVPEAGDTFYEVKDEKTAKHLIERRKRTQRERAINATSRVTLNDLFSQIEKGNLKQLNLIVKADVQGSVEAVTQSLEKLTNEEVQVKVIHANVGGVTESDVTLAKVSNAIIIAFNVRPDPIAKDVAKKEEVEIKQYSVIYQAIEDVEAAMKGMLDPVYEEKVIGTAEIRQTFKVSGVGTIAGCYVTDGKVARNAGIRVIRDNVVVHDGKLISLKRFKDDAKEVAHGYECGLQIEDYNDIIEGDTLEVYVMEEVKK
ncbi:MAG: translation initiation factor IF-2 [Clostridia bacterium]|nr:translation initiation factor IF-2 [Clostridia bacterium]